MTEQEKKELEEKIAKLESELDAKQKELETKKYLIVGKEEAANKIKKFIINTAKFKGRECTGIVELNKIISEYQAGRPGAELLLEGNAIKALEYFLDKTEATTLSTAEDLYSIYQSISQAIGSMNEDVAQYQELQQLWEASKLGIEEEQKEEPKEN